ncbi:hypothetical protein [Polymorphobacter megasporae]|uniref:hypothetical protein n=1 Tax=Glacieibacterium megasporae TaxID=2835787 RepID=UPI001C1DF571|nr:hypothetical protein [Polymorphobacter megasporae]UAJ11225.1 hypothetical protein KTC28_05830 [Polymorphobacter megasporae]
MPYRRLYKNRQEANSDYQPRQWYVNDAKELSWVADIAIKASAAMPVNGLRGFIVRHHAEPSVLRHKYTIVVAEGVDETVKYMERFIVIKELMHCYFEIDDRSSTDTEIILDQHMRQFFGQSARTQSVHVRAEYTALWMAMGVLCPERRRLEYRRKFESGEIALEAIAESLRAPAHIVRRLLTDQFEDEIREILN